MASLKYYNSTILFMMIIVIYLFSHLISFCYASQIKSRTSHHTLNLSQHGQLPRCINSSSTTNPAAPGKDSATAVFEVFHRQRLCAYAADGATSSSPSAEKILRGDQLRVQQIRHTKNIHGAVVDDHSVHVPAESGHSLGVGDYVVRIGLGTPARKLHLVFDTESDLMWTQCLPCLLHCYKQQDRTFDPSGSTTYSNISCTDHNECPQSDYGCYKNRTCVYILVYEGMAYSIGFLAKDKLTLTRNDVFPNFMFGCGQNNSGPFGRIAGVLGLSRGNLSVLSQTKQKYGSYFSYYLPSDPRSSGHLSFGRNINNTKDVKFTSLIYDPQYPLYYFFKITSITVGYKRLPICPSVFTNKKNIIDSGTTFTYLPQKAYIAMREEFKHQMNTTLYPIAPPFQTLDTCFRVPNGNIDLPTIKFTFEGKVTIDVDPNGIIYVIDPKLVCLAFVGNTGENDDISIFGIKAQQNMEVVYDVAGGKLGFGVHAAG